MPLSTQNPLIARSLESRNATTTIGESGFDLNTLQPVKIASALGKLRPDIRKYVENAAKGVDAEALAAVVFKESSGNPNAKSPSGNHFGLMQLSEAILKKHGVKNWRNPQENLAAGVAHMKEMVQSAAGILGIAPKFVTALQAYMLHQQGQFGGGAIIASAANNETIPAWRAIQTMVNKVRGPNAPQMTEAQAKANLRNNVPSEFRKEFDVNTGTAADFLRIWEKRFGPAANRPFLTN